MGNCTFVINIYTEMSANAIIINEEKIMHNYDTLCSLQVVKPQKPILF